MIASIGVPGKQHSTLFCRPLTGLRWANINFSTCCVFDPRLWPGCTSHACAICDTHLMTEQSKNVSAIGHSADQFCTAMDARNVPRTCGVTSASDRKIALPRSLFTYA